MKRTREWGGRMLALCLAVALLCSISACGGKPQDSSSTSSRGEVSAVQPEEPQGGDGEESVELVMSFWASTEPAALNQVFESLSEYTKGKIGVTVKPFTVNMSNYPQQINLMLSSGEQIDLMCCYYQWFQSLYSKGHLKELESLVESEGQGIIDAIGWDFLNAGRVGTGLDAWAAENGKK